MTNENGGAAAPAKSGLLATAQRLAEVLQASPEKWSLRRDVGILNIEWPEQKIGVREFEVRGVPESRRYVIGVVTTLDDGTGAEQQVEISAENDREARDLLAAALEPWRAEREAEAQQSVLKRVLELPGGASSEEAIRSALN